MYMCVCVYIYIYIYINIHTRMSVIHLPLYSGHPPPSYIHYRRHPILHANNFIHNVCSYPTALGF